ncbi:MAG: aldehyde dehydrogenase family protein [Anaerolineae bacterium]|nr:aldehyde dehydrogenase family protein [Anaerolineae bacterium]NIN94770.1 aldehyde dehydrogenase family protein [Anaerolineae bacterium]NIQ77852.1 aldehyde dehydrogenase family protein [Anaerolineae bacterium]
MWINGEFVDGTSGEAIEVVNPATEEVVDHVPAGTVEDARRAIAAANEAFPSWRSTPSVEKADLLHEVASKLRSKAEEIATTLTLEGGKPLIENRDEMGWSAACFDYYAEIGRHSRGRVIPSIEASQLSLVLKEPYGVVACIVPWNYPILLMTWKVAPALAAGNTVVIKPSSVTPLSTLMFADIFDALPPGGVNIVTGAGSVVGDELVTSPDTHLVAFTGSTAVGQRIAALTAPLVKKVHLELGGKDPFVVCEDADVDVAVPGVAWAALLNAGQVCTSTERVYVQRSMFEDFTERLADYVQTLRVGPGMDPTTDVGPMARAPYRAKVEAQVQDAVARGARILTGGRRPPLFSRGFYYEPTVLVGIEPDMEIMREETFGPVIPIAPYGTFDEAIELANSSVYGLGANIYTNNAVYIKRFYEEVKAGTIWVNDPLTDNDAGPFGGMKLSGMGRELGEEGIEEFRETKHVHWDFSMEKKGWWYPYEQYNRESGYLEE